MKTVLFQSGKAYESPSYHVVEVGLRPALCTSPGSSRESVSVESFTGEWDEE